jgi:hypothetical protein
MKRLSLILVVVGVVVGLAWATHRPTQAQGNGPAPGDRTEAHSIQDALLRPFNFTFARPTPLSDVATRLGRELAAPVVLDLAALDRLDIKPDETVKLELQGVRLKTGLKLLLDQVGLTYRVVPEDNLLILTDKEGSEDPLDRVVAELRELHRDIHDIQDTIDELREASASPAGEGAKVRKPTIIEEVPDQPAQKSKEETVPKVSPRSDPGLKPPGTVSPRPRAGI